MSHINLGLSLTLIPLTSPETSSTEQETLLTETRVNCPSLKGDVDDLTGLERNPEEAFSLDAHQSLVVPRIFLEPNLQRPRFTETDGNGLQLSPEDTDSSPPPKPKRRGPRGKERRKTPGTIRGRKRTKPVHRQKSSVASIAAEIDRLKKQLDIETTIRLATEVDPTLSESEVREKAEELQNAAARMSADLELQGDKEAQIAVAAAAINRLKIGATEAETSRAAYIMRVIAARKLADLALQGHKDALIVLATSAVDELRIVSLGETTEYGAARSLALQVLIKQDPDHAKLKSLQMATSSHPKLVEFLGLVGGIVRDHLAETDPEGILWNHPIPEEIRDQALEYIAELPVEPFANLAVNGNEDAAKALFVLWKLSEEDPEKEKAISEALIEAGATNDAAAEGAINIALVEAVTIPPPSDNFGSYYLEWEKLLPVIIQSDYAITRLTELIKRENVQHAAVMLAVAAEQSLPAARAFCEIIEGKHGSLDEHVLEYLQNHLLPLINTKSLSDRIAKAEAEGDTKWAAETSDVLNRMHALTSSPPRTTTDSNQTGNLILVVDNGKKEEE